MEGMLLVKDVRERKNRERVEEVEYRDWPEAVVCVSRVCGGRGGCGEAFAVAGGLLCEFDLNRSSKMVDTGRAEKAERRSRRRSSRTPCEVLLWPLPMSSGTWKHYLRRRKLTGRRHGEELAFVDSA